MKLSGGVEWALHCAVLLSRSGGVPVPAARLAEYHHVSASYLAKQLQTLSRAGIIAAAQGHAGGYLLTRPADRITVLDVVEAVDGPGPTFVCTEVRQRGPHAARPADCVRPCAINRVMLAADSAWRAALREVSVAEVAGSVGTDLGRDVLGGAAAWLTGGAPE